MCCGRKWPDHGYRTTTSLYGRHPPQTTPVKAVTPIAKAKAEASETQGVAVSSDDTFTPEFDIVAASRG